MTTTRLPDGQPQGALACALAAVLPDCVPELPYEDETTNTAPVLSALADQTIASLRAYFASRNHHPSPKQWEALRQVSCLLGDMADGVCPPRVFLSSLDPGVGKSSTAECFARALLTTPEYDDVGMIVCVARIAEAEGLAHALVDQRHKVAVWTTDPPANEAGGVPPEQAQAAQLLITTQQRIERATEGRRLQDVESLGFRGHPRMVRVWDEAYSPGRTISLNADDIGSLFRVARLLSPDFRVALGALGSEVEEASQGAAIDVPDWERSYGVGLHQVLSALAGPYKARHHASPGDSSAPPSAPRIDTRSLRDDQQDAATSLFALSGRTARVWRDNQTGGAVLSYRDTLPADLAPLLVLDASGRVRRTYKHMAAHRGLVCLAEAPKDYSPLTVHWWRRGGGKSSFAANGKDLTEGIAATILTKPTERWLVVTHRPDPRVKDVERAIRKHLPKVVQDNVAFISWGNHVATNDYADVPNLILAGTLFMRQGYYVSLTHLAQDRPTAPGFADDRDVAETIRGEHANLILQAVCRGRVRKSDGARCLPMDAYVIADPRSGIGEALPDIFPGCSVVKWDPLGAPKDACLSRAEAFIRQGISDGKTVFPFPDIQRAAGVSPKHFAERVTRKPGWSDTLDRLGLKTYGGVKRPRGVGLKAPTE